MHTTLEQRLPRLVTPLFLGSVAHAVLLFVGLYGWPSTFPMVLLSSLPLFMVGLQYGRLAVLCVGMLSLVFDIGLAVASGDVSAIGSLFLNIFVWNTAPVMLLMYAALTRFVSSDAKVYWAPAGVILTQLTCFGYVLIGLMSLNQGFDSVSIDHIQQALQQGLSDKPTEHVDHILGAVRFLFPFLPTIQSIFWLIVIVLNGLLAQWILRRTKKAIRPSLNMMDIFVPNMFLSILAITGTVGYLLFHQAIGVFAANIAVLTLMPYFVMGLSSLHMLAKAKTKQPRFLMGVVYMSILSMPHLSIVIAMLGIFEPWLGLRNKLLEQK